MKRRRENHQAGLTAWAADASIALRTVWMPIQFELHAVLPNAVRSMR
jgi:hypothetical protein